MSPWFSHTHAHTHIYIEEGLDISKAFYWNQLKEQRRVIGKECKNSKNSVRIYILRLKVTAAEWPLGFYHEATHRDQEWDLLWFTAQRSLMAMCVCVCVCVCVWCNFMTDVFLTGLMETTSATAHSHTYTHREKHRTPSVMSINPVYLKLSWRSFIHTHFHTQLCCHICEKNTASSTVKNKERLFKDNLPQCWTNSDVTLRDFLILF